ncbi:2Fe-2S iron-sulfur cluster-binding protein [Streptomyces cinerochromogenes]|uniref:2Fe-2S iron-sulfur cluster-binding protein n=1 Tax=Streptomyces cinerochromogenes TaxID=66422 RepID=UPI0033B337D6
MTDDQHGEGTPQGGGRWNPLPQGDYDDGATAFVQLPEGGIDALLSGDSPLAAPGHGYVPPQITATHADGAGDTWPAPGGGGQWPDPNAVPAPPQTADDRFTYQPAATQHWTFEEPAAPAAPGHDVTGQWSIPVAGGDLPDESGEYTTSSLVEQWGGGTPPATLPGGAAAPWATDGAGHAWDQAAPQPAAPAQDADDHPAHTGHTAVPEHTPVPDHSGAHPDGDAPAPDAYGYVPQDTAHPDTGEADTPGGTGEHAAAPEADIHGLAEADAHGLAEAPERPADAPAGHEQPVDPADAPEPATTPATAGLAAPEAPADAAQEPAPPAEAAGPEPAAEGPAPDAAPSGGTGADEDPAPAHEDASDAPEAAGEPAEAADVAAAADVADGAAEAEGEQAAAPLPPHDDHPLASYVLRVNGTDRPVTDAWIGESLLYVLRERLGLAGAKDGCSQGECGACNVQVDGRLVASCLVPAVTAAGSEVRTVEGLAVDGQPSDVQRALARCGAVQCGFCVPGMAMTVHDLLEGNPAPSELETRQALCGNLCRCSGYRGVLEAVREVVAEREASHAGPEGESDGTRIPHQAGPGAGGVHPSAFEAPGAFATPQAPEPYGTHDAYDTADAYDTPDPYDTAEAYDSPDAYGSPDGYDAPDPYGTPPGPHDQHYGQDGGQA